MQDTQFLEKDINSSKILYYDLEWFLENHEKNFNYYVCENDDRDVLVKIKNPNKNKEEVYFYRDGTKNVKYTVIPILKGIKIENVNSSHKLIKVNRNPVSLSNVKITINPEHDYWRNVKRLKIIFTNDKSITEKAKIYPADGEIYVNESFFNGLPYWWKIYILYHEVAHLFMADETKNDILASLMYIKSGFPPSQAIMCLKYTVSDENPEKDSRGSNASMYLRRLIGNIINIDK